MSGIIAIEFISLIASCIYNILKAIVQSSLLIVVACAFILILLISIRLYLPVYMVITPIVLIKYIFKPRT